MLHHGRRGILGKPGVESEAIALSGVTSFITYRWSSAGLGTTYGVVSIPTSGVGSGVSFSADGKALAVATQGSPYIQVYPWSPATGPGTKYADPTTLPPANPSSEVDVTFSPASDVVLMGHRSSSGRISAYPFNSTTGFGTKYANPASLPAANFSSSNVVFSPAGDAVAIGNNFYRWSSATGFGTKYADPSVLGNERGTAFSPDGSVVVLTAGGGVLAYPWNSTTGFGTKYADPTTGIGAEGTAVDFSPAGDAILVGRDGSFVSTLHVFLWSNATGFGTKFSTSGTTAVYCAKFSPNGNSIAVVFGSGNGLYIYPWSTATGLGTRTIAAGSDAAGMSFRKIP